MNNKEYKDYRVLDEEIEDLEIQQEDEDINNVVVSEEIEHKGDTQASLEKLASDIIDVEAIESQDQASISDKVQVVVYTPILTEEEENLQDTTQDINQDIYRGDIYKEDIYKEDKQDYQKKLHEEELNKKYEYKQTEYKNEQQETTKDTSFTSYVQADKERERSFLAKWSIRLAKLILFIMLLPVIGIIGGGILAIAGGVAVGILICIGGGLLILGTTCFVATQVNAMIIALGVSLGITAISFGMIILILCIMLIKKVNQLIHERKITKKNKEVR